MRGALSSLAEQLSEWLVLVAAAAVWYTATGPDRLAAALWAVTAVMVAWRCRRRRVCVVHSPDGDAVAAKVAVRMPLLRARYTPPPMLALPPAPVAAILQSIAADRDTGAVLSYRREVLHLPPLGPGPERASCGPDNVPAGVVSLDWADTGAGGAAADPARPIVLLVPGLTGSSAAEYIRRTAAGLARCGLRAVAYNPRGRGGNPVESCFLYSAGWTEDLRRVVRHIRAAHPRAPLYAAGYSLGANVLAKYLGEEGDRCELNAAACFAPPIDPLGMSNHFATSRLGRLLDKALVQSVRKVARDIHPVLDQHPGIDPAKVLGARTMAEFDGAAIAPMMGYDCASDYYRGAASGPFIKRIAIPALFVHANNDPIVPARLVRRDDFESNPNLIHVVTDQGAHSMDWPAGLRGNSAWGVELLREFMGAVCAPDVASARRPVQRAPAAAPAAQPTPAPAPCQHCGAVSASSASGATPGDAPGDREGSCADGDPEEAEETEHTALACLLAAVLGGAAALG